MSDDKPFNYDLRFQLHVPLLRDDTRRRDEHAFEYYRVELLRCTEDAETMVAWAHLFRVLPYNSVDVRAAAADVGFDYLRRVCNEAIDRNGCLSEKCRNSVSDWIASRAYILDEIHFPEPDAKALLLRALFVRAVLDHMSHEDDVLFVNDDLKTLPFWEKVIGAKKFKRFIVALGSFKLPDELSLLEGLRNAGFAPAQPRGLQ
jgi:hypothetical protein